MTSKTARSLLPCCFAVAVLVAPAAARADDVVAELTRDTPIAAYGGVVSWSDYDAATAQYRLVIRRGDRAARASIPGSRRAFDVSLGPDGRGRVVALYTRCRTATHGCDVYRYDVRSRRERKVASVSSPVRDEAWPVQWRDRVAFVRRDRAYVVLDQREFRFRRDPRGRRGGGTRVACDVPYVKKLSARSPSRRLDPGMCAATTGMSIRGQRIVQVTSFYLDFNAAESQVRVLRATGGAARVLARGTSGLAGYSAFASPSQSASAVWLTRVGNREPMDFLRIDLASRRLTAVHPNVLLAGRVAHDDRGGFWYLQAPEPPDEFEGDLCASELAPCRLVRASASPFSSALRTLPPQVRLSTPAWRGISGLFTDPIVVSGDLTRSLVRRGTVVRREPLREASLELLSSHRPGGRGPFTPTGLTTTTDQAGRWSFPLSQPPSHAYFAATVPAVGIASPPVIVTALARVTLSASGASLEGTVTPAQPGRAVRIQRLQADGQGTLPDGRPRCQAPNAAGVRFCADEAWITVATPTLDADGSAFSTTVDQPGFYRADLPEGENPSIYRGRSPEVQVVG